jgi:hypothetical protein
MAFPNRTFLGDTSRMKFPDTKEIPTKRMWRVYSFAWLAYLVVITFASQLDAIQGGRIDWQRGVEAAWSIPPALVLALLWPVSGYLERKRLGPGSAVAIHAAGALAYALASFILLRILIGPFSKPLNWYLWPFLYCMMTYAVIAAVFHSVRASAAAQRQAVAAQQAHNLLIASELSALRGELNPHFLFNTLHSIIALTRKDPGAAETALFQFSDMLRYVLDTEKNGNDRVTLEAELGFVRDYLQLEALRLGERLSVEWDLDDGAAGCPLPALSLQPLVENSIKHAFNPHSRPGRLHIRTRLDGAANVLGLSVGDDGPGADPALVRQSGGLGIRTVERRLQLEYGPRAAFAIDTAPGAGFVVTMSIPLEPA